MSEDHGDCFVVVSCVTGQFWDGSQWVPKWQEAVQFGQPLDPYTPACDLAGRLRAEHNVRCNAAYIPPAKVRIPQIPGDTPAQVLGQDGNVFSHAAAEVDLNVPDPAQLVDGLDQHPDAVDHPTDRTLQMPPEVV